jgi:hypothetical protein
VGRTLGIQIASASHGWHRGRAVVVKRESISAGGLTEPLPTSIAIEPHGKMTP